MFEGRAECDNIHGVFQLYPQSKAVVLYGSRAKGNFCPSSDIDLTLWAIWIGQFLQRLRMPWMICCCLTK